MRDLKLSVIIIGLTMVASSVLSLFIGGCSGQVRGSDMRLPAHLFKPFDALELRLQDSEPAIPDGTIQGDFFNYTPPERAISVIKDGNSTDTIDRVKMYFYKNDVLLFFNGLETSLPQFKRQEHFWQYLRENPIVLKEGDILEIKVTNQSGASQAVEMEMFGYTYPEVRHPVEEKPVR